MSTYFPAHQAESMTRLLTSELVPNITNAQTNKSDDDMEQQDKDTVTNTFSEPYLNTYPNKLINYPSETTLTYIGITFLLTL